MTSPADANLPKYEPAAADRAARGGKRRWLRFSLKGMFRLMVLVMILPGVWKFYTAAERNQR